jgi:hypothetical protein
MVRFCCCQRLSKTATTANSTNASFSDNAIDNSGSGKIPRRFRCRYDRRSGIVVSTFSDYATETDSRRNPPASPSLGGCVGFAASRGRRGRRPHPWVPAGSEGVGPGCRTKRHASELEGDGDVGAWALRSVAGRSVIEFLFRSAPPVHEPASSPHGTVAILRADDLAKVHVGRRLGLGVTQCTRCTRRTRWPGGANRGRELRLRAAKPRSGFAVLRFGARGCEGERRPCHEVLVIGERRGWDHLHSQDHRGWDIIPSDRQTTLAVPPRYLCLFSA